MELHGVFGLFAEEQPKDFRTIDTSRGDDDFQEGHDGLPMPAV